MKKEKLINFVSKYFLAGNAESVKLEVKDNVLSTKFITADQTVIGDVQFNDFKSPDIEFGVYTTGQFMKLLSALDDTITVNFNQVDGKVYSVTVGDTVTDATYMLSDMSVIQQVPNLKSLPEFDVEIELTKEFTSKFIKSKNALPDADNFAVESNGTTKHIIINHANVNTNKIKFIAGTKKSVSMSPVCFSAKLFKEILTANSDCTGTLEVSSKGLGRVTLQNSEFKATYYLVKLSIQ